LIFVDTQRLTSSTPHVPHGLQPPPQRRDGRGRTVALHQLLYAVILLLYMASASPVVAQPMIQDVRFRSAADETRIVIELDHPAPYQVGRLSKPDRLYIDFPKLRLAPDWERHRVNIDDERLKTIRIAQNDADLVRIVLDLKILGDFRIYTLANPYRVVIDLRGNITTSQNGTRPSPPVAAPKRSTRARPPTIVIDPGHGGKDPGAIGPGGLQEKTVVLRLAKELRSLLHRHLPKYRIMMTRDRDIFVPLGKRARLANQYHAHLFISIHANSSKRRRVNGIETWYLSFAANDRAKRTAERENQMSESELSDLEIILRDLRETDRINQSAVLASTMQTILVKHMASQYRGIQNRGVDGAPFVVLLHTAMPSVLVETAFISNPREERRLRSRTYLRTLAHGIFRGVRQYMQTAVVASE
jgi:N-acetylmuramoyl-L-alanine amidase